MNNSKNGIMYFESDEEFTDFCVAPYATIQRMSDGTLYVDGDYSDEYKDCIKKGTKFIIKDEDSEVCERQCVCKRVPIEIGGSLDYNRTTLVQLNIENLEPFFDDFR